MKSPSERGALGAWAYEARTDLDLSVEQVAERIAARGQSVSAATIRGIESGSKKPSARLLRLLAQALSSTPPGARHEEPGQSGDMAGLVVAMTRALEAQTRALTLLASQVSAARSTAEQERAALTDMLADLGDELEALRAAVGSGAEVAGHGPARN